MLRAKRGLFRSTRMAAALGLLVASFVFGACVWIFSLIATWNYWGLFGSLCGHGLLRDRYCSSSYTRVRTSFRLDGRGHRNYWVGPHLSFELLRFGLPKKPTATTSNDE
jgi:hypothetical protein